MAAQPLTSLPDLLFYYPWIAILRRHKALIPAKNVLYKQKIGQT